MKGMRPSVLVVVLALLFAACTPAGQGGATGQPASPTGPATATEPAPETVGTETAEPTAGTETAEPTAEPTGTAGEPKQGGTAIVAIPGQIDNTDPALISDSNSSYVMNQVMEPLVGLKPGTVGEVVPGLAEEWEVSDDGRTYTFTIREGVKFHDGTDLDAEAVKFNYDRWLNFEGDLQGFAYYAGAVFGGFGAGSNVESTEAPDAQTFVITLKQPFSSFLLSQALVVFGIASPTALEEGNANSQDLAQSGFAQGVPGVAMVGTGPFRFQAWQPGESGSVTLLKNEEYWDPEGVPYLDGVIFRVYGDQTAEFNALQAGDVDVAQTIAPIDAQTAEGDPNLRLIDRGESCNLGHLALNQQYEPVNNPDIRRAIMHALNREEYIQAFYAGQAVPADNWMPPATQFYQPQNLPTYDPEQAQELIEQSGVTDLTIDAWYPSDVARPYMPDPRGLFEAIQRDLEAVGFTVNPNTATWNPDYLNAEAAGEYEAWLIGWTCDWAGPDNFLRTAFFGYRDGEPNPEYAYDNDELEETMNQALASTDEDEQQQLWEQAQEMVAEDLPTIPLVHSTPPGAVRADVHGLIGSGALDEYFNTVWLDR